MVNDTTTLALLPCPFCGGPAAVEEVETGIGGGVSFTVGCSADEADCMGYQSLTVYARRTDAIAGWNRRAPAVRASTPPSEMKQYVEIRPVVNEDWPDAHNVFLKIGHQQFCVTPHGCENKDEAEWFREQLCVALANITGCSPVNDGKPAVEIRPDDKGAIDEIFAKNCTIHIEQMSADGWFMGIDASDGSYWQFWLGAKNRKSAVEVRHTEMVSAAETAAWKTSGQPCDPKAT